MKRAKEFQDAEKLNAAMSSPDVVSASTRLAVAADGQAAGAVYPTPPDGVVPPTAAGTGSSDTSNDFTSGNAPEGTSRATVDPEQEIKVDTKTESWADDKDEVDAGSKEIDVDDFGLASAGLDDDGENMFADMDEDMFNETGVTEADFSFFDQPGDDNEDAGLAADAATDQPAGDLQMDGVESANVETEEPTIDASVAKGEAEIKDSNLEPSSNSVAIKRETSPESLVQPNTNTMEDPDPSRHIISPPFSPAQLLKRILPRTPPQPSVDESATKVDDAFDGHD